MLAIEGANKEGNRLLLLKHTHINNTRPFSKPHSLMLAMEGAHKERNRLLQSGQTYTHTQHKNI